jgi:hypothetical protein
MLVGLFYFFMLAAALTIAKNDSALRDAPLTNAPSMFGWLSNSNATTTLCRLCRIGLLDERA